MNTLTKDEMKFCKLHLKTIEQIVSTSSCSCIPPDYLEGLKEINKKYSFTQCVTCNSSIFSATNRLYKSYVLTKEENKKNERDRRQNRDNSRNTKDGEKGNDRNDETIPEQS